MSSEMFVNYQRDRQYYNIIEHSKIEHFSFREEEAAMRPQEEYEFPTGFRKSFGVERFKIPEPIFNPTLIDGKSSICGAAFLVRLKQ